MIAKFNDFRYKGNVFINYRTTYNEEHQNHVEMLQPYRRILGVCYLFSYYRFLTEDLNIIKKKEFIKIFFFYN